MNTKKVELKDRYFKAPDAVRNLHNRGELEEFLNDSDQIEWLELSCNDIAVINAGYVPVIHAMDPVLHDLKFDRFGFECKLPDVNLAEDIDLHRSAADIGLFLALPVNGKLKICAMWGDKTYLSALERAGFLCPVMTRKNPTGNRKALQMDEIAKWSTRALQLNSETVQIPFRYGVPMVIRSKEYVRLAARDLIETFEDVLSATHPNLEFADGCVDVEHLVCTYEMNDREKEDAFKLRLEDAGHHCNEVKVKLRFSTSEIGRSGVHVSLFYEADGVPFGLGKGVHMEHKGEASIAKFHALLQDVDILFKENEERIEELGNMDITDPANVIIEIGKQYTNFPKSAVKSVADDLRVQYPSGGATGIDVYLALNDIVQKQAQGKNLAPNVYLTMCEMTEKMMRLPFDAIDRGEPWRKI